MSGITEYQNQLHAIENKWKDYAKTLPEERREKCINMVNVIARDFLNSIDVLYYENHGEEAIQKTLRQWTHNFEIFADSSCRSKETYVEERRSTRETMNGVDTALQNTSLKVASLTKVSLNGPSFSQRALELAEETRPSDVLKRSPVFQAIYKTMEGINACAAPIKKVEQGVGSLVRIACDTKVTRPICQYIGSAAENVGGAIAAAIPGSLAQGVTYFEENGIPREMLRETGHSLLSITGAVSLGGAAKSLVKTGVAAGSKSASRAAGATVVTWREVEKTDRMIRPYPTLEHMKRDRMQTAKLGNGIRPPAKWMISRDEAAPIYMFMQGNGNVQFWEDAETLPSLPPGQAQILPLSGCTILNIDEGSFAELHQLRDATGFTSPTLEQFIHNDMENLFICELKTPGSSCQPIQLPKNMRYNIINFVKKYESCRECNCLDFVKAANGLPFALNKWYERQWSSIKLEHMSQLTPGTTVALRGPDHRTGHADHYAIYLSDGLYVSKFGIGMPTYFTSLEEMHTLYRTDETYILTPNEKFVEKKP